MKTRNIFSALFLAATLFTLSARAGSDETTRINGPENINALIEFCSLAPSAPMCAGFEDGVSVYMTDFSIMKWAPVTPSSADFDDPAPESLPAEIIAAPVAPKEATFDDEIPDNIIPESFMNSVKPVAPKTADFPELL